MTMLQTVLLTMLLGIPALLFHEFGHIAAAWACGVKVKKVGLSRVGVYTIREAGPRWANIGISLAGPLFNLLLAISLRDVLPTFAWVNLIACLYNLLPIPNSDGRRVVALLNGEGPIINATPAAPTAARLRGTPV